jgi:3-hydroxyisobutyrate dehydrogenase
MLPLGKDVMDCYAGENGILSSVKPGTLLIDSSTIAPDEARGVADLSKEKSAEFIDAPVSGGVGLAKKGMLAFLVGGLEKNYTRAKPLLECMGKNIIHCGDNGNGQAAKICNNMLLGISMIGTSEALQLAIRLGLDPKVVTNVSDLSHVALPCSHVVLT